MRILVVTLILFLSTNLFSTETEKLFQQGWDELTKDNDDNAFKYFAEAYDSATSQNNTANKAEALLNMAICSYGTSYSQGLEYCFRAMEEYKKSETTSPNKALEGRCRCLQLISTIKGRQGKFREAISLSKEAMLGLPQNNDTTATLGLIYNSLGIAYLQLGINDSAEYFHHKALYERLITKKFIYLPASYIAIADIELKNGNKIVSNDNYKRALAIADSMSNRQAQVSALLGIGNWFLTFENNQTQAETNYLKAKEIASDLSDKLFYLRTLEKIIALKKLQNKFIDINSLQEEMMILKDSLNSWEKQKILKSLEVQFSVNEKERAVQLSEKEKNIALLTNYLLLASILFISILFVTVVWFFVRNNKRNKILLQTKEALVVSIEQQRQLKEQQLKNDIEYKESQMSAMTLQMLQKNELLQELKEKLEEANPSTENKSLTKIISKGLNQDKEWNDFNAYFESINKNFYSRIKTSYPDISPNELKICALIKMNLSIKEMAGILNISPDSVKTARYRLRKKLQLTTEKNLTDFILNLK